MAKTTYPGRSHDEIALAIRTLRKTKTASAKALLESPDLFRQVLTAHLAKSVPELIEDAMLNFTAGGYDVNDFAKYTLRVQE